MVTRLLDRLPHEDTRSLELALAVLSAFWGAWLLMPWPTFTTAGAKFIVEAFGSAGTSELLFGAAALAIGVWRFAAYRRQRSATTVAVFGTVYWGGLAVLFALASWHTGAIPLFGSIALMNLYIVIRATAR